MIKFAVHGAPSWGCYGFLDSFGCLRSGGEPSGADGGGWNKPRRPISLEERVMNSARLDYHSQKPLKLKQAYHAAPRRESLYWLYWACWASTRRVAERMEQRDAGQRPAFSQSQGTRSATALFRDRLVAHGCHVGLQPVSCVLVGFAKATMSFKLEPAVATQGGHKRYAKRTCNDHM